MKAAVFGGSGFLGHDFIRFASRAGGVELVVYSTSAGSLANVSRYDVDLHLYSANDPESIALDRTTDVIVNFAHPFERRGDAAGAEQIRRFVRFVGRAREENPRLRLIYLSSMSVYEPFRRQHRFTETDPLQPPPGDRYASEKVLAEAALRALPDADNWQIHMRPTVVYGPFCRPFTDRFFDAFNRGDVGYLDLSGRVQPILGEDISRFIYARLQDFRTGVYNLAGPEVMAWERFVSMFREIAGRGNLVPLDPRDRLEASHRGPSVTDDIRQLIRVVRREPAFDRMTTRIARRLPSAASSRVRRFLQGEDHPAGEETTTARARVNTALFGRPYFAEDRLVDDTKFRRDFPTLVLTPVQDVRQPLEDYYRFRYSDARFV